MWGTLFDSNLSNAQGFAMFVQVLLSIDSQTMHSQLDVVNSLRACFQFNLMLVNIHQLIWDKREKKITCKFKTTKLLICMKFELFRKTCNRKCPQISLHGFLYGHALCRSVCHIIEPCCSWCFSVAALDAPICMLLVFVNERLTDWASPVSLPSLHSFQVLHFLPALQPSGLHRLLYHLRVHEHCRTKEWH